MSKRKNFGSLMLLSGLVLAVFLLLGSFLWMQDKANMLLAVFVLILYGMGQWLTVVYWQKIQEDWESTGEILGRLQQAVSDIPLALDANLKSIATRLSESQQKALSELKAEVNDGARKTLETGAALIGDSLAKNFKAPVDSMQALLGAWDARTREQADRIAAMAQQASEQSAEAASRGAALIADSLDKSLRAPLQALEASLAQGQEKARAEAEEARALGEEMRRSQRESAQRNESLAASVAAELRTLAAEGARDAEAGRQAWADQAGRLLSGWDARAQSLEETLLSALRDESGALSGAFAAAASGLTAGLEAQVAALREAASAFEAGLAQIREASTALIRDVQARSDAGREAMVADLSQAHKDAVADLSRAQKDAVAEAARLLEAQGQLGLEVAGKVSDLAEGVQRGSRDLQELAHLSRINQAELQAGVGMLNSALASLLERLDSQAKAGEGYQAFLADLGRALDSFQERAAETLSENAMKTQEILMEVLSQAENRSGQAATAPSASAAPADEVASLS